MHLRLIASFIRSSVRQYSTFFTTRKTNSLRINSFQTARITSERIMTELPMGKSLSDILQRLEDFAPLSYAESWDNVGLLVDPMENKLIQRILLTNDLTENVVEEAVTIDAGLIVTYHPNIFRPLKTVISTDWKQRIVINCIKNKIAVFSPHTSWDCVKGGVNDWLASAFSLSKSIPLTPKENNAEEGAGRFCTLQKPITIEAAIANIKSLTGLSHLRLALAKNKTERSEISSIALCAGSGSSVLSGVQADLYLTGEMLHHDILDATQRGISVILCNHSDSERGFLKQFQVKLQNEILNGDVHVAVSKVDRDPLQTI
ncbi:NIF3-like protein 1 isoform X2 [Agrilus planipennis]|uniref:NIF3-like protein 1 n=1 Tax=Agrilus planipennis TaxID=224129 RepID=A0A1W4X908_AGRPL|nr:NIF3-like protein 1 isoform X2 [Agrilus planipennis]